MAMNGEKTTDMTNFFASEQKRFLSGRLGFQTVCRDMQRPLREIIQGKVSSKCRSQHTLAQEGWEMAPAVAVALAS